MAKFCTLPVVDLGEIAKLRKYGDSHREAIATQLRDALQNSGMCHVVNHGVPLELIEGLQNQLFEYFYSPDEEKRKYHVDNLTQEQETTGGVKLLREGLHTFDVKEGDKEKRRASDWRESLLYYMRPVSVRHEDHWPEQIREILPTYSNALYELSWLLLEILAESLGLPGGAISEAVGEAGMQLMAIHFYPVIPKSQSTSGMAAHTDTTLLTTLLCNKTPGLQILQNDEWVTVEPLPGALIVQPGIFLEVLTNGQFVAKSHRVTTPNGPRVSVVSGLRLPQKVEVEPLSRLLGSDTPALYRPVSVGKYMKLSREVGVLGKDGDLLDSFKIVNPVH